MMSLPLYCKQHLGENRPCFVYLDDKARKLRCLRANPQGETTIGVSAGGRSLGVDVGATAKERSQRLQHFFVPTAGMRFFGSDGAGSGRSLRTSMAGRFLRLDHSHEL